MKKKSCKIISILLAFILILSSVSMMAYAEDLPDVFEIIESVTESEVQEEASKEVTEPEETSQEVIDEEVYEEPEFDFNFNTTASMTQFYSSAVTLTGAGTVDSPYLIYTEEELIAVALGNVANSYMSCYLLKNDLELTADTWTPIGATDATAFQGIFDGDGHTISSTVLFQSTGMSGIFGINKGTIKNLNVNVTIGEVATDTGALVAANYGTVENCHSSGSITATTSNKIGGLVGVNYGKITNSGSSTVVTASNATVGGLLGYNYNGGVVEYSYATGDVTGNIVGGLIGEQYADGYHSNTIVKILDCYALGKVTGTSRAGGLVGYNHTRGYYGAGESNILYCYAKGIVASGSQTGGLIGYSEGNNIYIRYCYYNKTNTGNRIGFAIPISYLKKQSEFYGWNFNNIWNISADLNDGYPYIDLRGEEEIIISGIGSQLDPYIIENEQQLFYISARKLSNAMTAYYVLANDIQITANVWTPIGRYNTFKGVFDGNGHTIYGIKISNTDFANCGLFDNNSGTIKNLTVSASTIDGNTYTGAIVGVNYGTVSKCFVEESNLSNISGNFVGGMVGWNDGTITECGINSDVVSSNATVGGLVGRNNNNGVVQYSYSAGDVTGNIAGGLIGEQYADGYHADATTKTLNCYSMGKVTGTSRAGGLIGYNHTRGYYGTGLSRIEYCYARGLVAGSGNTGGLIGYMEGNNIVRYCYYNHANTGNKIGFSTSPSNMKKQITFYGWDFDNIWTFETGVNSGYPIIKVRGETPEIVLQGSGDEDDPYLIYTEEDLFALVLDKGEYKLSIKNHYKLMNDIEVTASHWTPIGANGTNYFAGTFDGNGHTISGIKLSNNYYDFIGLFGYNTGTIKNLNVEADIEGVNYAGCLVAYNTGKITNCSSSGSAVITVGDRCVGGIAGENTGKIELSNSAATVGDSDDIAGGLVGKNHSGGIIEYCHASGDVTGKFAGGLIGEQYADGYYSDITSKTLNCYSIGDVIGTSRTGGLIGYNHTRGYYGTGKTVVEYCYAKGLVSGTNSGGLIGSMEGLNVVRYCYYNQANTGNKIGFSVPVTIMDIKDTFYMWNFDNIWAISKDVNNGNPYINLRGEVEEHELEGYGDADDPYLIYTERDLWALVDGTYDLSAKLYYQLQNDIEITALHWTPIGANGYVGFNGVFDGNGYTISGLRFSNNCYDHVGFIGINNNTIKNLNVEVIFDGVTNVGAICANNYGTVDNCSSTGIISNYNSGQCEVGGLVGFNEGTVKNSRSDAVVYASNHNAGGLVGKNYNGGIVQYCYATGHVTGKHAGGLIGEQYADGYHSNITVKVSNCYAMGDVNGSSYAGGLIGYNHTRGYYGTGYSYVEYCYSCGKVGGTGTKGGLIGRIDGNNITVTSSYYNSTLSEMSDIDRGTPLNDNQMKLQSSYVGWDFDTIWSIDSSVNGGYPYIWTLQPEATVNVTGVTLDYTEKAMKVGDITTLIATITPSNALNKTLIWTTSNADVAYVSNGTVTACGAGTAVITVKTADGGFTATCTVTVTEDAPAVVSVESVTLDRTSASVAVGGTLKLTATVLPENATNKNVTFTSSNTAYATVDANGVVTGIKKGNVIITVKTEDGAKTATCKLSVIQDDTVCTHSYSSTVTTEATCENSGVITYTCSACGDTYTEVIPAVGHNYTSKVTAPTCTEGGYTTYTCANCGDTYTADETAATGHSYTSKVTKAATCTATGVKTYTCSKCSDSYTESIPATGHNEVAVTGYAATCTTSGLTDGKKCSVCGVTITAQTTIPPIGHTAGEAVVENATSASCGQSGSYDEVVYCTVCGDELSRETKTVDAVPHSYDNGVVTIAPTCITEGVMTYTCTVCGDTYVEEISATGHNYVAEVTAPTCEDKGYTTYTCSYCNDEYTSDETAATGHNFVDNECTVCGEVISADAPEIIVDSKLGITGKEIKVAISLKNNPGITSMLLSVNYDTTKLQLVSVDDCGNLGTPVHSDTLGNPYTLSWANDTATEDYTYNGEIVVLTFNVLENAELGETEITVSYDNNEYEIINKDMKPIDFKIISGIINIINVIIGDVNEDGKVNTLDRVVLTRYIAKWAEYSEENVNLVAADVNCDGKVNTLDRVILTRYIAKWSGYETLPYNN